MPRALTCVASGALAVASLLFGLTTPSGCGGDDSARPAPPPDAALDSPKDGHTEGGGEAGVDAAPDAPLEGAADASPEAAPDAADSGVGSPPDATDAPVG